MNPNESQEDLYAVLGVPDSATDDELREAYRSLAAQYHPDKFGGNPLQELANEKMVEVNRAWAVLGDPVRRARYDAARRAGPLRPGQGAWGRADVRPRWLAAGVLLLALRGLALVAGLLIAARLAVVLLRFGRGTPLALVLLALGGGFAFTRLRARRRRR